MGDHGSLECSYHESKQWEEEEHIEEEWRSAFNRADSVCHCSAGAVEWHWINSISSWVTLLSRSSSLSTIQHQCVKLQDATRGFMVVWSGEAADVCRARQSCFLRQSRVSSSLNWNALIVRSYCRCLWMFLFFLRSLQKEQNVFHLWLN